MGFVFAQKRRKRSSKHRIGRRALSNEGLQINLPVILLPIEAFSCLGSNKTRQSFKEMLEFNI